MVAPMVPHHQDRRGNQDGGYHSGPGRELKYPILPLLGERNPLSTVGGCDEGIPRGLVVHHHQGPQDSLISPYSKRGFLSIKIGHLRCDLEAPARRPEW